MEIKVTGRELKPTEAIIEYVEKRAERLEKYFDGGVNVEVSLKEEGMNKISAFTVEVGKKTYRAISENQDLYASIDKNIDILERQIRKAKEIGARDLRTEMPMPEEDDEFEVENEIIKYQTYEAKPMDPEDAKMMLQEQKNNVFLTFIDINTNKTCVIFRLKDKKNFGLVVPE